MKRKVNILMVDDQPGKLLSYEAILGDLGENLIKAASRNEALEQLLKNDVAVVLIDVNMPGVDGFELADMIRQHPRFEQTAMIFVSAIHMTKPQITHRGNLDVLASLQLRRDPAQIPAPTPVADVAHRNTIVGAQNLVVRKSCPRQRCTSGK
jgi:CheY-like chemotaxis protein